MPFILRAAVQTTLAGFGDQGRQSSSEPESTVVRPERESEYPPDRGPATVAVQAAEESARFAEANPLEAVIEAQVSAVRFFEAAYDGVLIEMIRHVVGIEGPVLYGVLARRVARAHGFSRTGSRIQERVEHLAAAEFGVTEEDGTGTFYWPKGVELGSPIAYRPNHGDAAVRSVEEICMPELVSLARLVRTRGLSGEDAMIAMAREVGLQRLKAASRGRLESALASASATKDCN